MAVALILQQSGFRQDPTVAAYRPCRLSSFTPSSDGNECSSAVRPVHCAGSELVVFVLEQDVERGE